MHLIVLFFCLIALCVVSGVVLAADRVSSRAIWGGALTVVFLTACSWLALRYPVDRFAVVAVAIGALVAASEVVSRYRDEPLLALAGNVYGAVYLLANGLVSAAAYTVLCRFQAGILPQLTADPMLRAIVAGFGAAIVMRSSIFSIKTKDGETIQIGPDAVIRNLLATVDRGIDRIRSQRRLEKATQAANRLRGHASKSALGYISASLASFQNLSEAERTAFVKLIQELVSDPEMDDHLKLLGIFFAYLNIAGERQLDALVDQLDEYLKSAPQVGS